MNDKPTEADGLQFLLEVEKLARDKLHTLVPSDRTGAVEIFYRPSSTDNYRIFRQNGRKFVVILGGSFLSNSKRILIEVAYRLSLLFDGLISPMIEATEVHPISNSAERMKHADIARIEKYRVVRVVASNGLMVTKYIIDEPFLGEKLVDAALVELQELSTLLKERSRLNNNI